MARHTHVKSDPTAVRSGMYGNGGRPNPNNGHADITPNRSSKHARRDTPYRVSNGGAGIERHKGHKFSQQTYESLRLGW